MKTLRFFGFPLVAATILVLGCAESPSPTDVGTDAPGTPTEVSDLPGPSAGLLGDVVGTISDVEDELTDDTEDLVDGVTDLLMVTTVRRTRPVGGPATCAVATIGRGGGTLECEEAGLRVVFPRGALDEATEISIRIPDRNLVGYEFSPHGLEFERPVQLRQSVRGTELERSPRLLKRVVGAYVDEVSPVAEALEILPALLEGSWWDPDEVRLDIRHFSGYIWAMN